MKILNIILMTVLFFDVYFYSYQGVYLTWQLALVIIMIWDYKLTGWED